MSSILLLLHPTVVTDEHLVLSIKESIAKEHERYSLEQQIINRVTKGDVILNKASYDEIIYINPNEEKEMPISLIQLMYDLLKPDGIFKGDLPIDQKIDVLMTGFIIDNGKWIKPKPTTTSSVLLRKKPTEKKKLSLMFKKLTSPTPGLTDSSATNTDEEESEYTTKRKFTNTKLTYFSDNSEDDSDDEIINEDDLIKESKSDNLIIPKKCELPNGKRRRKACKDCTCGLKELEEKEESNQRSLQDSLLSSMARSANEEAMKIEEKLKNRIKFKEEDLSEIDFTVKGKTGGCGSCALGDAFRCDGCPYLGLPPFKPGEVITLDGIGEDI